MGAAQEVGSSVLLFALVFGMSATVDIDHLKRQLANKNALLTGIFLQFVVLPFLGFAVVKGVGLSAPMGITLLVITSSPGGSYSNWWCSLFNADLALSVTMTAISTVFSLLMLPVNLIIYAGLMYSPAVVKNLDWRALFVSLVIVIGAIGCGLLCSAKVHSHKFNLLANKLGNLAGVALVVFSIVVSSSDKNAELWNRDWWFYLAVAAPCAVGMVIANFMTSFFRLEKPERVTVSVECCYQNTGIATSVAINMFEGDDLAMAISVPLFYGIVEACVMGTYLVGAWKCGWTKAPKGENICVVIATSYEVEEAEIQDPGSIEVIHGLDKDGLPSDLIFQFDRESEGYVVDERSLELSDKGKLRGLRGANEETSFGNEEERGGGGPSLVSDAFARACEDVSQDNRNEGAVSSSSPDRKVDARSTALPCYDEPDDGARPSLVQSRSSDDDDSPPPRNGGRDDHVRIAPISPRGELSAAAHPEEIRAAASFDDVPGASPLRRNRLGLPRRKQRQAYHRASLSDGDLSEEGEDQYENEFDSSDKRRRRRAGRQKYVKLPIPSDNNGESKVEAENPPLPAEEHRID